MALTAFQDSTADGFKTIGSFRRSRAVGRAWLADERSRGEVRGVILRNMQKLAGVAPEAFPPEAKF